MDSTELPPFSVVEFPGVLRNASDPSKAIHAMGGEHAVSAAVAASFESPARPLALNLRPGVGVSASNIAAEKPEQPKNLFVLRVTERGAQEAEQEEAEKGQAEKGQAGQGQAKREKRRLSGVFVGRVSAITSFRGLSDFQYHSQQRQGLEIGQVPAYVPSVSSLPPSPVNDLSEREVAAEAILNVMSCQGKRSEEPDQFVQIDRMRPMRFARGSSEYGTAEYWFRQYGSKTEAGESKKFGGRPDRVLGEDRRSSANRFEELHHRIAVDAREVPAAPHPSIQPPVARGREGFDKLYDRLVEKFEERPIWIRRGLSEFLPAELLRHFNRAVRMVAYSFHGPGPFFQAWIRYGYDPRKDPLARKYQVVEVRLNNPLLFELTDEQGHRRRNLLSQIPLVKNNFVQICDIQLPEVAEFCKTAPVLNTFDKRYGFFSKDAYLKLTKLIKATLYKNSVKLVGKDRAEQLLAEYKVTSNYTLKNKRNRTHLRDVMKAGTKRTSYQAHRSPSPNEKARAAEDEVNATGGAPVDVAEEGQQTLPEKEGGTMQPILINLPREPLDDRDPFAAELHVEENRDEMSNGKAGEDIDDSGEDGDSILDDDVENNAPVTGAGVTGASGEDGLGIADVDGFQIFGDDTSDDDGYGDEDVEGADEY